jgi:UMF1 family MFS transporter
MTDIAADPGLPAPGVPAPAVPKRKVAAWALWDAGSAGINAITTTFVFSTYLTSSYFYDKSIVASKGTEAATATLSSQYGLGLFVAGVVVALLAPVLGQQSDARGRRKLWLAISTAGVVLSLIALFFVQGTPSFFLYGLIVFGIGTIFYEIANVNYNAMLAQVSNPKNVGRISGVGWASGYLAGIVLLLIVYFGLVSGSDPSVGGFLHVPTADGLNIRVVELIAAVWTLAFSLPVLFAVPELPAIAGREKVGFFGSYVVLVRDIGRLWKSDRNTVVFLIASAVFRDGLVGVFSFGAIIARGSFGFSTAEVLYFGIAANVVAGVSTLLVGRFDDRLGPKPVMMTALVGIVIAGLAIFFFHDGGQIVFWVGALVICLFVGPAQSASRSFLTRVTPQHRQGEIFGLYATTGRAASFLAPAAFSGLIAIFGAQYWGMLGIVVVIAIGLVLMLLVRAPEKVVFTEPIAAATAR